MNPLKHIAVFTGSAMGHNPAMCEASIELAKAIAKRNATLIYGGANIGLMKIIADTALANSGSVIGVLPHSLQQWEIAHSNLTELILVDSLAERKEIMVQRSDSFIALPGGIGTLDELFEVYTLARLEHHHHPIGLLNVEGYYDHLLLFLDTMTQQGFLDSKTRHSLCVSDTVNDLLIQLENATSLGSLNQERFAARTPIQTRQ